MRSKSELGMGMLQFFPIDVVVANLVSETFFSRHFFVAENSNISLSRLSISNSIQHQLIHSEIQAAHALRPPYSYSHFQIQSLYFRPRRVAGRTTFALPGQTDATFRDRPKERKRDLLGRGSCRCVCVYEGENGRRRVGCN